MSKFNSIGVLLPLAVVSIAFAAAAFLTSCGGGEGRLKARSVEYYNYLTGANGLTSEDFDSPARSKSLTADQRKGMERVAEELKRAREEIRKQAKVEPVEIDGKLVSVRIKGKFGITVITARIPVEAVRVQVRWVRDRGRWYRFQNTEAEVDAYGEFPADLTFAPETGKKDAP